MKKFAQQFISGTEGQDLIEYALLAATISIGVLLGMQAVRDAVNSQFTAVSAAVAP